MFNQNLERIEELSREELMDLFREILHRGWMHYGLWFHAARAQMEPDRFAPAERKVFQAAFALAMQRLGKVLGFEVDAKGLPQRLGAMDHQDLVEAVKAAAVNWYATDGIWFQQLEKVYDMDLAKRANDSVWARYSPYEAEDIRQFLGLSPQCGLSGLRAALPLRTAAMINHYTYEWDDEGALIARVVDCRIQTARRRKGLPDYPCKSAGMVEHSFFARALDPNIQTSCLACPPDAHPDEWVCAWRFSKA